MRNTQEFLIRNLIDGANSILRFNGDLDNPYLPENFKGSLWVVYSGTHDNPTTLSWWYSLDESIRDKIKNQYVDENLEPAWKIIDIGMSTDASLFIAPLQDILNF